MPVRLTQSENKERDRLVSALNEAATDVKEAVENFNLEFVTIRDRVTDALDAYNGLVQEATQFAADIASKTEDAISEKSDKWQESEAGQAATNWKDEWENLSLDDVEIDLPEPDEIDVPDFDAGSQLEELPNEADA